MVKESQLRFTNYELWGHEKQRSCDILVENEVPKFIKQRSCEINGVSGFGFSNVVAKY